MKKKVIVLCAVMCLAFVLFLWVGIGPYSSGSAMADLEAQLVEIYGGEYSAKAVEGGTEDMAFSVTPKTWFLTNWNLRNSFGMDDEYECRVVFTTHLEGGRTEVRTITYRAVDPMGAENEATRAYLDLNSKSEETK